MRILQMSFALLLGSLLACAPGSTGASNDDPDPDGGSDEDAGDDVDDQGPAGACGVSPEGMTLVEQRINQLLRDVSLVGSHMRGAESAYALTLPGEENGQAGFAFLVEPCTAESEFDPYCDVFNFEDQDDDQICLRLACEGPGILLSQVWLADPGQTAPGDDHVLVRSTEVVAGTATYDPNPFLVWRADVNVPDDVTTSVDIDWTVVIETDDGKSIDASHAGSVASRRIGLEPEPEFVTATMDLTFPRIASDGEVTIVLQVADDGAVSGTVELGDVEVGVLHGPFEAEAGIAVTWSQACTDP